MTRKKHYSTFDIAKLLDVYHKTVSKWADDGKLQAFVTPGGHRRVSEADLLSFLKEFNMPIPSELEYNGKSRILIVDDEKPVLSVIKRIINKKNINCEIETATDGFVAGQMFSDFKPDLIILDIKLPGIDGVEVCRAIRGKDKNVKIIAITGYDVEENKAKILKAGADDFMQKPLDLALLIEKIEKMIVG